MNSYEFKYGTGTVSIDTSDADIIDVLKGKITPEIEDLGAALIESINNPVGTDPLKDLVSPGDKLTIVISDITRHWMKQDKIIPHLINYLNDCGIPDEDMILLIANGTHRNAPQDEIDTICTPEIAKRIQVVNHECEADNLVYIGTTSFGTEVEINPLALGGRKIITLGACAHHIMAGFGGGRKSILPGIVSKKTINQNHIFSLDPNAARSNPLIGNSILEGNPLHLDMCEAAAMANPLFIINLAMNTEGKHCAIISGHWYESWLKCCEFIDSVYEVKVEELADVAIASCGGFPKDISLYQGSKTIDNVENSIKPGGLLILVAKCVEGGGHPEYFGWSEPLKYGCLDEKLRENFGIPGYCFYLICEQAQRRRLVLLSDIDPEAVKPMGIEAYSTVEELMKHVDIKGKRTYIIPNGGAVMPRVK